MPKVRKLGKAEPPPIDWLWAAMLERRMVLGITVKDMAKIAGVSYGTMRNHASKSPWEWSRSMRERMCKEFGITIEVAPAGSGIEVTPK